MASSVPLPLRVAAGLVATGIDQLRRLPDELPELSVTAVGRAMQWSMRVQQGFTQLAGRGEELIDEMFSRPAENPSWARFDEDESAGDGGSSEPDSDEVDPDVADSGTGAPGVEDYDELRLAQLRARLGGLDLAAVERLLEYEREHLARASFLTLLANRISKLQAGGDAVDLPESRSA